MNDHISNEWKSEYWDIMMSEDFNEGLILKEQHFPKSFFKYRSLNNNTVQLIEEDSIWLAEISSLNDPFECSLQFDNDECLRLLFSSEQFNLIFASKFGKAITQNEIDVIVKSEKPYETYIRVCSDNGIVIHEKAETQFSKVQSRWKEIIDETNQNIKICSFSDLNQSVLMWTHYADEHKGICIEYDFLEDEGVRTFLQPVIYRDKIFKIKTFEELTSLRKIGSTLIKSKEWQYESEWRLTILKEKDDFPNKMIVSKPKAVYLGSRYDLNDRDTKNKLIKILDDKKIPINQMKLDYNEYKLTIHRFR